MSTLKITNNGLENSILKDGQFVFGRVNGNDSSIISNAAGSYAGGYLLDTGYIKSSGEGSYAHGYVYNSQMCANGKGAHAEGCETVANADYSHAEGYNTFANGKGAHAEGYDISKIDTNINFKSFAGSLTLCPIEVGYNGLQINTLLNIIDEGHNIIEYNNVYSKILKVYPDISDATQYLVLLDNPIEYSSNGSIQFIIDGALAVGSHTEGLYTVALGTASHAEGYDTLAGEILYTFKKLPFEISIIDNNTITGTSSWLDLDLYDRIKVSDNEYLYVVSIISNTERFIIELNDNITNTLSDWLSENGVWKGIIQNNGQYSHAEGHLTKACGEGAHAEGYAAYGDLRDSEIVANGVGAHAEGYAGSVSGVIYNLNVSDSSCIDASGYGAHAEGILSLAISHGAHAEGVTTHALNIGAHAEGVDTVVLGEGSHAEGYKTNANGPYSHAEGQSTLAYGSSSHAEGFGDSNVVTTNESYTWTKDSSIISCLSSSDSFVANKLINIVLIIDNEYYTIEYYPASMFGIKIKLNKNVTAESGTSKIKYLKYGAIGTASHTEGQKTLALGNYSHAGGEGTIALGTASVAIGKYNRIDTDQLFTIGNGSSDTDRKNLFTLYNDGLIEYSKLIVDNTVINQDYGSYIWYDHSEQANAPALLIKKYYRYIIIKNRPSNDKNLQNIYLDRNIISRYNSNEYTIPISILNLTNENIKFRFISENGSVLTYIDIRPCEFYHATLYKSLYILISFHTAPASYQYFAVLYKYYNNWSSDLTTLTLTAASLTTPSSDEYEVVNTNKVIIKKYFRYIDVGCACDIAFSGDVFANGHKIVSVCSAFSSDTVYVYYNANANAKVDLTNGQYVTLISSSATFTFNTKTCTKMFRPDIG